jgi:hypothetical protein
MQVLRSAKTWNSSDNIKMEDLQKKLTIYSVNGGTDEQREKLKSYHNKFKMAVFWVVAPFILKDVYRRFIGDCCLQHEGDDGGCNHL